MLLLAVHRFGAEETSVPGESFYELWRRNGGVDADLRALTPEHVAWLVERPPLALEGDALLLHADTPAYLGLGRTIEAVTRVARAVLVAGSVRELDDLLLAVSDRMRLDDPAAVQALLDAYGGARIVHGHTPIASLLGVDPRLVTAPFVYGDGRVTNVDHCLFGGGPGFVTRL